VIGSPVDRLYDVGITGIHRVLSRIDLLQKANVIVAVAGMEGALPSLAAGLVSRPVIAIPTSIDY
jgi:NCAIR mutase (PurE)-related protein